MKYALILIIAVSLLSGGCTLGGITTQNNTAKPPSDNGSAPENGIPGDKKLDLSSQGLTQIPEYVFGQTGLEELDVSGNQLGGAIQAEIRQLENLRILRADNNNMTGVPAEIGQLSKLEVLDLSDNQLTGLPLELGNLKNLKTLDISGNDYSTQDLDIILQKLPDTVNIVK